MIPNKFAELYLISFYQTWVCLLHKAFIYKTKLVRFMGMSFSLSTSNGPSLNRLYICHMFARLVSKEASGPQEYNKAPHSHLIICF